MPWTISILVVGSLAFLFYLMVVVAWLSGWSRLARTYRAAARPSGAAIRFQSARFGWVDYSGCVTFIPTESGLHISMMPPFGPGHRPLFIPWSAMTHVKSQDKWYGRTTTVSIDAQPPWQAVLPSRVFDRAAASAAASTQEQP